MMSRGFCHWGMVVLAATCLVAAGLTACRDVAPTVPPLEPAAAVMVGAGDIASCFSDDRHRTAAVIDTVPGTVFTLGDNAYENGATEDFRDCYDPSWGRFKARTRPAAGNHEFFQPGAGPYFAYFGAAAGAAGKGWYSYELGTWHVIVLNSDDSLVGDLEQLAWLRADLASSPSVCVLAYWHHPRFSSGQHGDATSVAPFWRTLYAAGADVVLSAHDHDYERFAPQTPDGEADPARGIREFVVGTGGAALRPFAVVKPNSEVRRVAHGVLRLILAAGSYGWTFIAADGTGRALDAGEGRCH